VATLLVEGPATDNAIAELLVIKSGKNLSDYHADRPIFSHFGGSEGEDIIVRRHDGVNSLELHCHGGYAAIETIEKAFVERGFFLVSWKDWIEQSSEDPFAAEALIALADARTERTASILLDQYHGVLRRAFEEIECGAGCQPATNAGESGQVGNLPHKEKIEDLLERDSFGLHLTKPWRVVLIGEPNVGKSSLLNALVGFDRAIVHHTPGTTRDLVVVQTAFEGWPVELCDTAGLRVMDSLENPRIDPIERAGIELAQQQIAQADLLLSIFDAGNPWTEADEAFLKKHPQALVIHNKVDLLRSAHQRPAGLFVSAATGQGIEELSRLIARRLVPNPPPPGAAVPFTKEQIARLHSLLHSKRD
jgi:tRNA modification GTPase